MWHHDKCQRTENRASEEVRAPAAQWSPRAVARVPDQGLDQQTGERRSEPEDRNLVRAGAEVLVNGAHVCHLQTPAKLYAEEAEAHIPDLPKISGWFLHFCTPNLY